MTTEHPWTDELARLVSGDLVVPVDGSDRSVEAFDRAIGFARETGLAIRLVRVMLDGEESSEVRAELSATSDLYEGDEAISITTEVIGPGPVADALDDRLTAGDLVCIATRAAVHDGDHFKGSVAEALVAGGHTVLMIGPVHDPTLEGDRVMVPVDGSALAEQALPLAGWIASKAGTQVVIAHAQGAPTSSADGANSLDDLVARIEASGVATDAVITSGGMPGLAGQVANLDCGLAVMATSSPTGMARLALGSSTADFVAACPCPVLVLHPPS